MAAAAVKLAENYQRKGHGEAPLYRWLVIALILVGAALAILAETRWWRSGDERDVAHRPNQRRTACLQSIDSTTERVPVLKASKWVLAAWNWKSSRGDGMGSQLTPYDPL